MDQTSWKYLGQPRNFTADLRIYHIHIYLFQPFHTNQIFYLYVYFSWFAPLYPWSVPFNVECQARWHQLPFFFESLVWLDLGLNTCPWTIGKRSTHLANGSPLHLGVEAIQKRAFGSPSTRSLTLLNIYICMRVSWLANVRIVFAFKK